MKLEKFLTVILVVVVAGVLVLLGFTAANADGHGPVDLQPAYVTEDGQEVYIFEAGTRTCVRVGDQLECFCNCDSVSCDVPTVLITPTDDPNGTPEPTLTPVGPTPTPTDPGPEPTEKPKCNRGIGNLSEDCDPGNSSGQGQGGGRPAGEDRNEAGGPPGNQNH